ncbi:MrcB family domain-containing protein [Streptomyces sp. NPDC088733]|uniref:MrcB family domain-containing protein n=1 Tax=Streptomyces sp. NPDC088733 TaxID=3365880 RepID=UPI0038068815
MEIRNFLYAVGTTFGVGTDASTSTDAAQLLRRAPDEIGHLVPAGYLVEGSPGRGNAAVCPWVSFFDPDETTSATRGMYLVYLLAEDRKTFALSLNQGVTEITKALGARQARKKLAAQAEAIREALPVGARMGLDATIDLGGRSGLPRSYEAGNLLAITYDIAALPDEQTLRADLSRMITLYQDALAVREEVRQTTRDTIVTVVEQPPIQSSEILLHFAPKSDKEYVQVVTARWLRKSRSHETLVHQYGTFLRSQGIEVGTNVHPRDLVVIANGTHWLAEAKFIRRGNATGAVREALGQLATYAFCLYPEDAQPHKMALFSEPIGDVYTRLLEHHGIAAVWRTDEGWAGSPSARAAELA